MVSAEVKVKRRRLMPDNVVKFGDSVPTREFKEKIGGNGESSHNVAKQGVLTIRTGCNPKEFKETVLGLSNAKTIAINEMGFGPLQRLGCSKLNREICQMLVDNFDVGSCSIKIHGRSLCINEGDFQRVMGVRDGGTPVSLEGYSSVEVMKDVMSRLSIGHKEITVEWLKKIIKEGKVADDTFKVCFVMYALAILLCPTTPGSVDVRFLFPLQDPRSIGTKNWATFCFRHLLEGVSSYQKNRLGYMSGCILFLQLFYFDSVAYSTSIVSKSIEPVVAWTSKRSRSLIEWIIGKGGFNCSSVYVTKIFSAKKGQTDEFDDGSTGFHSTISEDIFKAMSEVSDVESDVRRLSSMLGYLESNICILRNKICEVEQLVVVMKAGAIECIVADVMKVVKSMGANTFDHVGHVSKEEIDAHQCGTAIGMETKPRQLSSLPRKPNDGCWQKPLYEETEPKEVDPVVDERVVEDAPKVSVDYFNVSSKARKRKDRFPSTENISQKDLKMLKFLFSNGSIGVDKSRVEVARFGEIGLSHSEFQCLLPKIPLSSKVINILAAYLFEEDSNSWFLPTYIGEQVSSKDNTSNVHASLVSTIIKCGLQRFHRRLKKCCEIFIPLHDEIAEHWFMLVMKLPQKLAEIWDSQRDSAFSNRRQEIASSTIFIPMLEPSKSDEAGHWYLLVIHPKDRYAKILDSAPSKAKATSRQGDARAAMSMLDAIFFDDFIEHSDASLALGSLPFSALEDTGPIQPNATDCGLFVIRNMQRYGSDWAANYDSEAERASLVIDCLRHEKNEVGDLHVIVDQSLLRWRQNENNEMYDLGKTETANKKYGGVSIIEISEDSTQIGIKKCARDTTLGGV